MLLSRFSIFKQRKPREFNYRPFYYKEEENSNAPALNPGERIRTAYGQTEQNTLRDRMEERRHFGAGYDPARGMRKLLFLRALLGVIAVVYFVYL